MELRSEHQRRVDEFMELAKQELPAVPTLPSAEVRKLRASLILEEAFETAEALGFMVFANPEEGVGYGIKLIPAHTPNLVEIIDGCCDISVVTTGTLSACGVPDVPFIRAIDENNLAKFGPGHSYRPDGKLIKPPGHKKPDIESILQCVRDELNQ